MKELRDLEEKAKKAEEKRKAAEVKFKTFLFSSC